MTVDTTRIGRDTTQTYPPLLVRRSIARAIDLAISFGLACLIVLPFTLNQAADALLLGGFDSLGDFLGEWDVGTVATGSVGAALDQLQPVVLSTVYLQALVIWAYDWLSHTVTGSTVGKAITRVRVTRHRTSPFEPTMAPDLWVRRSWLERALRMAVRAALVVGPPTLAAGMLLASAFAVPGAVEVAELFIAVSIVLLVTWLAGGVGLHGLATSTRVVGFDWQELKQEAERQIEYHTGHADEYLHRLQEAARTPGVQKTARSAEHDPRVRSALAKGGTVAQQAEQQGRSAMVEALRSREDATAAAHHLGEVFKKHGLRGVIESFTRRPPGSGGV